MASVVEPAETLTLTATPVRVLPSDPDRRYFIVAGPQGGLVEWWIWPTPAIGMNGMSPERIEGWLLVTESIFPDIVGLEWWGRSTGGAVPISIIEVVKT